MIMGICIFQLLCCIGFIACAPLNLKTEPVLPFSTKAPDLDTFGSLPLVNPESEVDIFTNILKVNQDSKNNEYPVTQGDIILPKPGRMATTCTRCLWPKSVDGIVYVPYTIAPKGFTASNMETIRRAMLEYETLTCIRFVNRTKEKDFLTISYSSSCTSFIGRIGGGQVVQLNPDGCLYQGSIQHELHHALGFYHEVSRPDRDEHILVKTEFIDPSYLNQFAIFDGNTLDLPYDYNSVMHYSRYAFTINASVPVLIPIPDPNVPIGQRIGLSVLDIQKVNKLYKCDVPCSTLLNGESGTFTSNNFPSQYPNNMSCTWLIRVPRGQAALTFNYINIQETDECVSDYIRIYDGPTKNHPVLLDKACGTPNLPMIIASTYHMLIEFVSDNSVPSAGFNASYKSVQCGGFFYKPTGTVTSPGYEKGAYPPDQNCIYYIYAPRGYQITLNGTCEMEAPVRFSECYFDYLYMYAGGNVDSRRYTFCGFTEIPPITSTGNLWLIMFKSDWSEQFRGFQVTYKFVKD